MLSGKVMTICLIAPKMKKVPSDQISYYPEPENHCRNKIKVDLSNYAQKWGKYKPIHYNLLKCLI